LISSHSALLWHDPESLAWQLPRVMPGARTQVWPAGQGWNELLIWPQAVASASGPRARDRNPVRRTERLRSRRRQPRVDGFGNACDADYNNDLFVGGPDFLALGMSFGATSGDPAYDRDLDANGDGVIGGPEFLLLGGSFGKPPGPSGLACAGSVPCP
jgi:hypothetical protein